MTFMSRRTHEREAFAKDISLLLLQRERKIHFRWNPWTLLSATFKRIRVEMSYLILKATSD